MEKRFFWGVGVLVLFLVMGLLAMVWVDRANAPVVQDLEQAVWLAKTGALEQAEEFAARAKAQWKRCWKGFAVVADHSPMDEIDGLFGQMGFYAEAEDAVSFGACCARLAELVEAVADAHRLNWWNLL